MALLPKVSRNLQGIDFLVLPPRHLIARLVQLAMVPAAKRHRELVAYFHADGARLRKSQMMRIAGLPAADEAGLGGDEIQVRSVAYPLGLGDGQRTFVDPTGRWFRRRRGKGWRCRSLW